jgi:hypothetical protein
VKLKNTRQKEQDSENFRFWAATEGGDERTKGKVRLTIREQINVPGGNQPGTNRGIIAAQNCRNV